MKRGAINFGIVLTIIVVVAAIGHFVLQKQTTSQPTSMNEVVATDTGGYTFSFNKNSSGGYTLKYNVAPNFSIDFPKGYDLIGSEVLLFGRSGGPIVQVDVQSGNSGKYLDMNPTAKRQLNGNEVLIFEAPNGYCHEGDCGSAFVAYQFTKETYVVTLVFYGDTELSSDERAILDSFKFIDSLNTNDWKTYRDEKFGLEFQYSGDYVVFNEKIDIGGELVLGPESCRPILSRGGGEWPKDCQTFSLIIQKGPIVIEGGDRVRRTTTEVAGFEAEKIHDENGGMFDGEIQTYVQFKKGDYWYISFFTYNVENMDSSENVFAKILSTLKFTK